MQLPKDAVELIQACNKNQVSYLIIGGIATIHYGYLRLTGDVDFFYDSNEENCKKLYKALFDFWATNPPMLSSHNDLMRKDQVLQYGLPPNRIDIISEIEGVTFTECWKHRNDQIIRIDGNNGKQDLNVPFIGFEQLIKNKKATGRQKDKNDVFYLTKNRKLNK